MLRPMFIMCAFLVACAAVIGSCLAAVPMSVSYQGKLTDLAGQTVTGSYNVIFRLFPSEAGGSPLWTESKTVQVEAGVFQTALGSTTPIPGSILDGSLYLEVVVEGTTLAPREQILASAFAMRAGTVDDGAITSNKLAGGAVTDQKVANVSWGKLVGVPAGFADGVDNDATYSAGAGLILTGSIFKLDFSVTDGAYWKLGGNSSTSPGTNFLGTTDNQPLELKVNGQRVVRLEQATTYYGDPSSNVILGYSSNAVTAGVGGAAIGGGGSTVTGNRVTDDYGTVAGGYYNLAGDDAGDTNDAAVATVGGGVGNRATGSIATIAGGQANLASGMRAVVAGGVLNSATGHYSAILGGDSNLASYYYSTVAGGYRNEATRSYSFAAGRQAKSNHDGTFVWADSSNADFASSGNDQFLIRANGGVGIGTNAPAASLDVSSARNTAAIVTTSSTSASASAVLGRISSTSPGGYSAGVRGMNEGTGGSGIGVYGSQNGGGWGVYGTTVSGSGVRGYASGSGNAVDGYVGGTGWAGIFSGGTSGHGVSITTAAGKTGLMVSGGTKNAVVATSTGARLLYTEESTEVWFTDYGFGRLENGRTRVTIDPLFAETVDLTVAYHVFVQLNALESAGVGVLNKTATSFEVGELQGGRSNAEFSYRIVARRKNYERARLERAPNADNDPNLHPDRRTAQGVSTGG